jgi:membrane protease YdiL (CAAX protease family)
MIAIIRRAPVATFAVLAYAISWSPWFIAMATGRRFGGIFPFGPMIAAFAVAALAGGRSEVAQLGARLIRWRMPVVWWLAAILLAIAPLVATGVGVSLMGGAAPKSVVLAKWPSVLATFPMVLILGGPLGEEIGWRGFGVSKLVEQGRRPLAAALIIGVVWAGWHLPLFLTHKMPPPAAIVMVIGAVTMAWLYLNSGESALLLTAFHAIGNTLGGAWFFSLFAREDIMKVILLRVTVEIVIAAAVVVFTGRDLGRRPAASAALGAQAFA